MKTAKLTCPHCGGTIKRGPGEIVVSYEARKVVRTGYEMSVDLTAQQAKFLAVIAQARPLPIAHDDLARALYGADWKKISEHLLMVHKCNVNKKIAALNIVIVTLRGTGMLLVSTDDPRFAAINDTAAAIRAVARG